MPAAKPAADAPAPATTDAPAAPAAETPASPAAGDDQTSSGAGGFAHATETPEWTPVTVRYRVSDREEYPYASMVSKPQAPNGAADISFTTPQGSAGFAAGVPHVSEVDPGQPHWQEYDA